MQAAAEAAGRTFGFPYMLKSRRLAYDGRGNAVVSSTADLGAAVEALGGFERGLYAEKWAPFSKELSVMVARYVRCTPDLCRATDGVACLAATDNVVICSQSSVEYGITPESTHEKQTSDLVRVTFLLCRTNKTLKVLPATPATMMAVAAWPAAADVLADLLHARVVDSMIAVTRERSLQSGSNHTTTAVTIHA